MNEEDRIIMLFKAPMIMLAIAIISIVAGKICSSVYPLFSLFAAKTEAIADTSGDELYVSYNVDNVEYHEKLKGVQFNYKYYDSMTNGQKVKVQYSPSNPADVRVSMSYWPGIILEYSGIFLLGVSILILIIRIIEYKKSAHSLTVETDENLDE